MTDKQNSPPEKMPTTKRQRIKHKKNSEMLKKYSYRPPTTTKKTKKSKRTGKRTPKRNINPTLGR